MATDMPAWVTEETRHHIAVLQDARRVLDKAFDTLDDPHDWGQALGFISWATRALNISAQAVADVLHDTAAIDGVEDTDPVLHLWPGVTSSAYGQTIEVNDDEIANAIGVHIIHLNCHHEGGEHE
jgi:hypothetical protein